MASYPQLKVESSNLYPALSFSDISLRIFFSHIFSLHHHDINGCLSLAFLGKKEHSDIHGRFLQDYRPTDVITFPADQKEGSAGEILISVDQAIMESRERGIPLPEELSLYLIHGWLHLIGFDDIDESDRKIMRREEKHAMDYIRELGAWPDFLLASTSQQ
jgi:probable rRNA maturation factor